MTVKSADKKPEKYVDANGKTKIRMVPVDKEVIKMDEVNVKYKRDEHGNTIFDKKTSDAIQKKTLAKMRSQTKDAALVRKQAYTVKKEDAERNESVDIQEGGKFSAMGALRHAKKSAAKASDHLDGTEVWKHPKGHFEVNATMNSSGRDSLKQSGAKRITTVYRSRDRKNHVIHDHDSGKKFNVPIKESVEQVDELTHYKIHRSFNNGKSWEHNPEDTHVSLNRAKSVAGNMMQIKGPGKKVKITKHVGKPLAGPKGKLPESAEVNEVSDDKLHDYIMAADRSSRLAKDKSNHALKLTAKAKTASSVRRAQKVSNKQADKHTKRELGIQMAQRKQSGRARVNATESVTEAMKPISKKEYDTIRSKHKTAKAGTVNKHGVRTGKPHADTIHVFKKDGEVHHQHYSHDSYKLPSVAKNSAGTKHYTYEAKMEEAKDPWKGQPVGVHVHMKDKSGKVSKTTFLGTHQAVAGAKKHIADMQKKGHKLHKKELAFSESVDQIDEISKKTLGSYIKKAANSKAVFRDRAQHANSMRNYHDQNDQGDRIAGARWKGKHAKLVDKENKRTKGIAKAVDKLTKEGVDEAKLPSNYAELMARKKRKERLAVKRPVTPEQIKKLKGKAPKKYDLDNNAEPTKVYGAPRKESVEQVDEISQAMAGRYVRAADKDAVKSGVAGVIKKRIKGMSTAFNKLSGDAKVNATKEEMETPMSNDIQELKRSTLASYVKKAAKSARASTSLGKEFDDDAHQNLKVANDNHPNIHTGKKKDPEKLKRAERDYKTNKGLSNDFKRKAQNRVTGIGRAADRLAKESKTYDSGWVKAGPRVVKDKSGAKHDPMSRAQHLSRLGLKSFIKKQAEADKKKKDKGMS
jgi:hypothetical protein